MQSQHNGLEGSRVGPLQNSPSPSHDGELSEVGNSVRVGVGRNIPTLTSGHVGGAATDIKDDGNMPGNRWVVPPKQKVQTPIIMMNAQNNDNMRHSLRYTF